MKSIGAWVWPIVGLVFGVGLLTAIIASAAGGLFGDVSFVSMAVLHLVVTLVVLTPLLFVLLSSRFRTYQKLETALDEIVAGRPDVAIPTSGGFPTLARITEDLQASRQQQQDLLQRIAGGNLQKDGDSGKDGFGGTLHAMRDELHKVIDQIVDSSKLIDSVAKDLEKTSAAMIEGSEALANEATMVASSSEESSATVNNIAAMTEELTATVGAISDNTSAVRGEMDYLRKALTDASENVASVSAAVEEMSASIGEVSQQTVEGSRTAEEANQMAQEINTRIQHHAVVVQQVTKIVDSIKDIADQTNMLALNATIEAAGAGQHGKGFAVVAQEVKELARQSAESADSISGQIETMLADTREVEQNADRIADVISNVAKVNENIAVMMEQQSSTVQEIAHNMAGVSQKVQDISERSSDVSRQIEEVDHSSSEAKQATAEVARNVADTSTAVKQIAQSVNQVSDSAKNTLFEAKQVEVAAEDMEEQAGRLANVSKGFQLPDARFDLSGVKLAHLEWRKKINELLHEMIQMDESQVTTHTQCVFGQWYHAEKGELTTTREYKEVGQLHERIHSTARDIVATYNAGQEAAAEKKFQAFKEISGKLFNALDKLHTL